MIWKSLAVLVLMALMQPHEPNLGMGTHTALPPGLQAVRDVMLESIDRARADIVLHRKVRR